MTARILDGKRIADALLDSLKAQVDARLTAGKSRPGLAVVLVGVYIVKRQYTPSRDKAAGAGQKGAGWLPPVIARWLGRMANREFHDVSCGFRAYARKAFLRLNPQGDFTYTHEVFLSLAFAGLRIREVPVEVRGVREHGKSRVAGNLFRYAWQAAAIILATYRDYRPLAFFGSIAGVLGLLGFVFLAFLGGHWVRTGALFPYKAVGFAGGALCGAALLVYLIGLVAAMLSRLRSGVETAMVRAGETEYHR